MEILIEQMNCKHSTGSWLGQVRHHPVLPFQGPASTTSVHDQRPRRAAAGRRHRLAHGLQERRALGRAGELWADGRVPLGGGGEREGRLRVHRGQARPRS